MRTVERQGFYVVGDIAGCARYLRGPHTTQESAQADRERCEARTPAAVFVVRSAAQMALERRAEQIAPIDAMVEDVDWQDAA